jgi:hypothetical protein
LLDFSGVQAHTEVVMFDPAQACGPPPMARNRWPAADSPQPRVAKNLLTAIISEELGQLTLAIALVRVAVEEFLVGRFGPSR